VTLGDRLRRARLRRGLTQMQLSILAGVRQPTISALETNKRISTQLDIIAKLAGALGVKIGTLIEESPNDDSYAAPHMLRLVTS
jgi:transcriptional regulator with XRE-family HTH domain